jgi:hypothetical protein
MSSPQGEQALEAATMARQTSQRAYGIALPALGSEYSALNAALAQGGEPDYVKAAYGEARGGIREGAAMNEASALRAAQAGRKGSAGASAPVLPPELLGSSMAKALYGPRVSEAAGSIEQTNKLLGASLGQSSQTGSGALRETGVELQNIGMMRNYNQGYAAILAALNAGGSIYGAAGQRTDPYAAAIAPGGTSGSFGWQGFSGSGGT